MPEIIREVKVLRVKYSILQKTESEYWTDKKLLRQLENEYETEYKESMNLKRLLENENAALRKKYNADDLILD